MLLVSILFELNEVEVGGAKKLAEKNYERLKTIFPSCF